MLFDSRTGACIPLPNMGPCASPFQPPATPYAPMCLQLPTNATGLAHAIGHANDSRPRSRNHRPEQRHLSRSPRRTTRRTQSHRRRPRRDSRRGSRTPTRRRSPAWPQTFRYTAGIRPPTQPKAKCCKGHCAGLRTRHNRTSTSASSRGLPPSTTGLVLLTVLCHAKEAAHLCDHHLRRRLGRDSGLPIHTMHRSRLIDMAANKHITKVGEISGITSATWSATSRTPRIGPRPMLSSLIKNEFAHCRWSSKAVMSYQVASTKPSPTSRRPFAPSWLTCFWRRALLPVPWNCRRSRGFKWQTCGIAFASPYPP